MDLLCENLSSPPHDMRAVEVSSAVDRNAVVDSSNIVVIAIIIAPEVRAE